MKEKKKNEEDDYSHCDTIEGCRTIDVVDSAANKKVMDMTRSFIRSVFDKTDSSSGVLDENIE